MPRANEPVVVLEDGLAGLAVAARLAKRGHRVTLVGTGRTGGDWSPADTDRPDLSPSVLAFPAPWRDLFRKSGRPLEEELRRLGHALVPAPPVRHTFADGSMLDLPTGRAEQLRAVDRFAGPAAAAAWRDLVDGLGDVWQGLRFRGIETPLTDARSLDPAARRTLWADRSVADLADALPDPRLGAVVSATATLTGARPVEAPALVAVDLFVDRTFGRWRLAAKAAGAGSRTATGDSRGDDGHEHDPQAHDAQGPHEQGRPPVPLSAMVDLLTARLALRRVERTTGVLDRVETDRDGVRAVRLADGRRLETRLLVATGGLDDLHRLYRSLPLRWADRAARAERRALARCTPALAAPRSVVDWPTADPGGTRAQHRNQPGRAPLEQHDHGIEPVCTGPVRTYQRHPGGQAVLADHGAARPDPAAGVRWRGFDGWLDRPPTVSAVPGLYLAGPAVRSGTGADRQLLGATLAATEADARVT